MTPVNMVLLLTLVGSVQDVAARVVDRECSEEARGGAKFVRREGAGAGGLNVGGGRLGMLGPRTLTGEW